ncbi:hypothetical protein RB195_017901 [Necator americanus]|uniref:Uncharacterized protein n=1 Tax=Necator americanus TaxID=51031 RepID=A0ABR1C7B9_NECAM
MQLRVHNLIGSRSVCRKQLLDEDMDQLSDRGNPDDLFSTVAASMDDKSGRRPVFHAINACISRPKLPPELLVMSTD